jgi:hypothetical protein
MKKVIYHTIFLFLISIITVTCEKDKSDCPEAPADLRCGSGIGSICAVYHYSVAFRYRLIGTASAMQMDIMFMQREQVVFIH